MSSGRIIRDLGKERHDESPSIGPLRILKYYAAMSRLAEATKDLILHLH